MSFDWPDPRQWVMNRVRTSRRGEPSVHPNGFIQVKIAGDFRLHFWHPEVPRQEVSTPMHDHTFDMHSDVLLGEVIHVPIVPELVWTGGYRVHYALPEGGAEWGGQTTLVSNGQRVRAVERPGLLVRAGQSYDFAAFNFHRSDDSRGPAVSCIHKTGEHVGSPRVLVPHWAEPDNGFQRDEFTYAFCRDWIERIVEEAAVPERAS